MTWDRSECKWVEYSPAPSSKEGYKEFSACPVRTGQDKNDWRVDSQRGNWLTQAHLKMAVQIVSVCGWNAARPGINY